MSLRRVLIANRGEIAVRIVRACKAFGVETVVAVSEADRDTAAARMADRAVCVGPARSTDSYLNVGALVMAAVGTGCDGLHPGYGFLAENPALASACAKMGVTFIGPSPESIEAMGNKIRARALAREAKVPVVSGSDHVKSYGDAAKIASDIGYPILLKAASGGGGRGMKVVSSESELQGAFETASAEARAAFGDPTLYVERYIANARHVEVQVLGDAAGHVIHLGERDCSLQRRHQKVVEEAPASEVPESLRSDIRAAAVALAQRAHYKSAGTVEFIVDQDRNDFSFLEMNTRIQVEHPVSEAITGVDLIQQQLRVAQGEELTLRQEDIQFRGHAIECRITAEAAEQGFRPSPGKITVWEPPTGEGVRLDTHCFAGYTVPPFYDSLLAKLIVWGPDRASAVERMSHALKTFRVEGVATTLPFLRALVGHADFVAGRANTRWIETNLDALMAGVSAGE